MTFGRGALLWLLGIPLPIPRIAPSRNQFVFMTVYAPLLEEVTYRALLALAILPVLGERGTILVGGAIFAMMHVKHGNPGVDNQIAGFMLMWAYLRSGTLLVPLAMHAAGNCIAFLVQSAHFCGWLPLK